MPGTGISKPGTYVVKSDKLGFIDSYFKGLPTGNVKIQVDEVLVNKEKGDTIVEKILSGEYTFFSRGIKDRYIDNYTGYYVYTFILNKAGVKQEVDIIFYSTLNSKIIIKVDSGFFEILISEHPQILDMISKIYPLPVYTEDVSGGVSLINKISK